MIKSKTKVLMTLTLVDCSIPDYRSVFYIFYWYNLYHYVESLIDQVVEDCKQIAIPSCCVMDTACCIQYVLCTDSYVITMNILVMAIPRALPFKKNNLSSFLFNNSRYSSYKCVKGSV